MRHFPGNAHAAFVVSTSQVCTGSGAGECETAPSVFGPGNTAQLSRAENSTGFSYMAETNMTGDYLGFAAFARASGFENPEGGGTFINSVYRSGVSYGHVDDVLTAGEGGAPGFFRLPLHVTGGASISWQNGFGTAGLTFQCVSSEPGSAFAIGHCPDVHLTFTADAVIDQTIVFDVPIVLGSPFEYRISAIIQAATGHAYGDAVPFTGASQVSFGTSAFTGASVLDASKVLIPNAPISASESGFQYAPEPASAAGFAAALAALLAIAARRELPDTVSSEIASRCRPSRSPA